jgi:nitrate reductase NapAB chaperone NapD
VLAQSTGIDVYVTDGTNGRIVVVLETETVDGQEAGLRRVQALPLVMYAELVYHYFGDAECGPLDPASRVTDDEDDGMSRRRG